MPLSTKSFRKTRVLAALLAGTFGHLAAAEPVRPVPSAAASRPAASSAASAALAALKPGQRVEIKLDAEKLFALKRHDAFKLPLGSLGELPVVFDHATKVLNSVAYWEAHLDGDLAQRISLRMQDKQLSGTLYLRDRKLTIETTNGRSFLVSSGTNEQAERQLADRPRLFAPVPAAASEVPGYPGEAVPRASWPVSFNAEQLKRIPLNSEVALDLPDGRSLAIVHDNADIGRNGSYTFIGYVREQGTDHRVVITSGPDGSAYGVLNLREGEVRLESRLGRQWLVDVKKSGLRYAPMVEPRVPPGPAEMPSSQALRALKAGTAVQSTGSTVAATALAPADSTEVDLMVVYSPGMVSRLGSDAAARTRIDNLLAITNQAMLDSDVQIRMRLVHGMLVNQADNVNQSTLLSDLQAGRGEFAGVAALRDQYGADLVQFVHKPTAGVGSCGIAYLSVTSGPKGNDGGGFSVIDDSCPTVVMPHELGHNFGNNHDHAQGGNTPVYPYAWGYIVPGTDYGDIMAYASSRYYKFSNPRINGCAGQACGQANYADASLSMNNVRQIVAGYRPTGGVKPATGTCFYQEANYQGASLCVESGSVNLPAGWDNRISSVKVKPEASVTLYQDANFGGSSLLLSGDLPNLAARNFNDTATSYTASNNLNGRFLLQAVHSGKCVDLRSGNSADGASLVQWTCNGGSTQQFDVSQTGSDGNRPIYRLTIMHTGKLMDVARASLDNGTKVWQWTPNGTGAQQFYLRRVNATDFAVLNRNSGKALDVKGRSLTDGAELQQWGYVAQSNQRFRLAPIAPPFLTP